MIGFSTTSSLTSLVVKYRYIQSNGLCRVDVPLPACVPVCYNIASVQSFSADDSSRVVLSVPNASGTDYINASFVDVSDAYKCSIGCNQN